MIIRKQEEPNLIKSRMNEGLWQAKLEGDNFKLLHAQKVDEVLDFAHKVREFSNNGFTHDRGMRMIGYIPALEFVKHPEFMTDPNAIKKWLKTPAGEPYRTVKKGL